MTYHHQSRWVIMSKIPLSFLLVRLLTGFFREPLAPLFVVSSVLSSPHYFAQWKLFWKWYPFFKTCFVHYFTRVTVVWCYIASLWVLFKAFHVSDTGVLAFCFNSLVKVYLGFMPPHQVWPFCRRKGPQKEHIQGFTGRVELAMLTAPGLWQTVTVASVKVLKRTTPFYKVPVTTKLFQFPKERRNLKEQVKELNSKERTQTFLPDELSHSFPHNTPMRTHICVPSPLSGQSRDYVYKVSQNMYTHLNSW